MKGKTIAIIALVCIGIVFCIPLYLLLDGSLMEQQELQIYLSPILNQNGSYATFSLFPSYPTLGNYIELLLDTPEFFMMFWNSIKMVVGILVGQFLMAVPAAWGFARLKSRFQNLLFQLYIILMLMPFQVMMLSNYISLDKLGLMNTQWAVILPAVFSTFPVFILYHFFREIPVEVLEAANIDGAGRLQVFLWIAMPLAKSGIISAGVLGFLEYWNLVEQPLIFLKDPSMWPLSLYLPEITLDKAGLAFGAAVVVLLPSLIVFFAGQEYLEQGISASAARD